jgi:hypothetical protein
MEDVVGLREDDATTTNEQPHVPAESPSAGVSRTRFIGWLIAGPTLIAAAPRFIAPARWATLWDGALLAFAPSANELVVHALGGVR